MSFSSLPWLLALVPCVAQEAIKVELTEAAAKGAVCLDGSPAAYYLLKGTGDGINKWYVHHEGGGWCESLDDCLGRSKTDLGSSARYPEKIPLNGGYFSKDPQDNPLMYNWNNVFMKYCDGASFSGNNDTVTKYQNTSLFFRGKRIREAIVKDLMEQHGLNQATDLMVSGCSAGGLATYLHADQWCEALQAANPSAKCAALPDSGFFLDYQDPEVPCTPPSLLGTTINGDYHCGLKWTFHIQNATAGIDSKCVAKHTNEEWKCMFAEHAAEHIQTPVFAMQSVYDSWQVGHVEGTGGSTKTQMLGKNITERLVKNLLGKNPKSGAFLDGCYHHCGAWNLIRIDGDLVSTAIQKWYDGLSTEGNKRLWNQDRPFPCKDCCSPGAEVTEIIL
ncbi:Pectin acetylesterase 5 [Durusdinium trenchii]|uniref:Pectin acetylesterase 5 n=2 Tax=Durusdinium trenchii TaxID=1381693 RepID=A0ABP0INT2_9DINO